MRRTLVSLILAVAAAAPAQAGPLLSARLSGGVFSFGILRGYDAPNAAGMLDTSGRFTLDAGNGFRGTVRSVSTYSVYGPLWARTLTLYVGENGALSGSLGSTGPIGVTGAGIAATRNVLGVIGGNPGVVLSRIQTSIGGNQPLGPTSFLLTVAGIITLATRTVSVVEGDLWHLGTVTATGLTAGSPLPDVTARGGVSTTPAGNTVITLVTLAKTATRTNSIQGIETRVLASPTFLTLTYAPSVPEPATGLLLLVGLLSLGLAPRGG